MNNEIKEILNDNDELLVRYKDNSFECFDTLPINVLDLITNLQQENEELKKKLDRRYYKNEYERIKKENERLKENNSNMQEEMARVWEENERLNLELSGYREAILRDDKLLGLQDYKSRCEKAIEYVKRHDQTYFYLGECELLNILQNGSDDNE